MKPKAFNTERLLEQRDRALKEITEERDRLQDGIKKIIQGE